MLSNGERCVVLYSVFFTAFYYSLNLWSVKGFEVSVVTLFLSSAVYFTLRARLEEEFSAVPYVLLALGICTRPDMIVPFGVMLIYNLITAGREFYNTAEDPGETSGLTGAGAASLDLLEQALYRTILDIDETWYVEMAGGGTPRTFDLEIVSRRGPSAGRIYLPTFILPAGRLVEVEREAATATDQHTLSIQGLAVEDRTLLAFKSTPDEIPVAFDLMIDGNAALENTYLGAGLEKPAEMPFSQKAKREGIKARGRPGRRPPESPYIAVWITENVFRGDTALDLSDETRRELRSLGYIQ